MKKQDPTSAERKLRERKVRGEEGRKEIRCVYPLAKHHDEVKEAARRLIEKLEREDD